MKCRRLEISTYLTGSRCRARFEKMKFKQAAGSATDFICSALFFLNPGR